MLTVGVDVGGTKVAAGVVRATGEVVEEVLRETPGDSADQTLATIVAAVDELAASHDVTAVGVGAAGFVTLDGEVLFAPHLAWRGEPLADRVAAAVGVPVYVDNDANCAAWGEWRFGAARGAHVALCVTLGTGIGGGLVVDGRLLRGRWGLAVEPGHMLVKLDGEPCACGERGCWEAYASGGALLRAARDRGLDVKSGPEVTAAARGGDKRALAAFGEVGRWLGLGLANLAALFDPDVIVVGGGVGEAGDLFLEPARDAFADRLPGRAHRPHAAIRLAALGNTSGMIGAADLARRVA